MEAAGLVGIEKETGWVAVAAKTDGYRSTGIDAWYCLGPVELYPEPVDHGEEDTENDEEDRPLDGTRTVTGGVGWFEGFMTLSIAEKQGGNKTPANL